MNKPKAINLHIDLKEQCHVKMERPTQHLYFNIDVNVSRFLNKGINLKLQKLFWYNLYIRGIRGL